MHRVVLAALLLCCLLNAIAYGEQEMRITSETQVGYADASGPGADQSISQENGKYSNLIGLNLRSTTADGTEYSINFGARATDNRMEDYQTLSLQNIQAKMTTPTSVMNLGDTFETFSQYSASSAIKGISYKLVNSQLAGPEYTFIFGYAVPRWDNLYNNSDESRSVKREARGLHMKYPWSNYFTMGASFIDTRDSDRVNATDELYDGSVYGVDWEFAPFEGLSLTGESQFSNTTLSPSDAAADTKISGSAHRLTFDGEGDKVRMFLEYERISPDFYSALGSAIQDREKIKFRWRERQSKSATMTYGMLWYRDNLDGSKGETRNNYKPEISYNVSRVFSRPYSSVGLTYKLDIQNSSSQDTENHYLDLSYGDRIGVFDTDSTIGYVIYDTSAGVRDSKELTLNTSWSTRFTKGDTVYRPSIYLGTWRSRDELLSSTDTMMEYSLGLNVDWPKSRISSNIRLGTHSLKKGSGDDSSRFFTVLNVYYRPQFRVLANETTFFLRARLNDFNTTDDTRDFSDTSFTTGMSLAY